MSETKEGFIDYQVVGVFKSDGSEAKAGDAVKFDDYVTAKIEVTMPAFMVNDYLMASEKNSYETVKAMIGKHYDHDNERVRLGAILGKRNYTKPEGNA